MILLNWNVLLLLLIIFPTNTIPIPSGSTLQLCELFQDNIGSWILNPIKYETSSILRDAVAQNQHCYKCSSHPQSINFDYMWLPDECSYHRFTNQSIDKVSYLLKNKTCSNMEVGRECFSKPLNIVFLGDSALRGIFCAISRIYVGNETHGPCQNAVCGVSRKQREISIPFIHWPVIIPFGRDLTLTFYYVKSLKWRKLEELMEFVITIVKPHSIVFSTGAWDFYDLSKKHRGDPAFVPPLNGSCHNEEMMQISLSRSDSWTNQTMNFLSDLGDKHGVRLIYRNNHFNRRFGAICADQRLEQILKNSNWQIWDNRLLSQTVWMNQTYDGFHFDWPVMTYSVEDHAKYRNEHISKFMQAPGMLVMQLAHSLLQNLFHDVLESL